MLTRPRLLVAAPSSGSGKTTVSMVLAAAFRAQGLTVQACKTGPDYLDPTHLAWASGREAYNLDSFFLDEAALRVRLVRLGEAVDLTLVEGVMGLFDGRDSLGQNASSAHLAKILGLPVVLVVDASAMAGSIAAIAQGFRLFDSAVNVCGVIANRVGSERHAHILREALEAAEVPWLGYVARDAQLELPSRHLGLYGASEARISLARLQGAARALDLSRLLSVARSAPALPQIFPPQRPRARARVQIGVARDEAFCFYYPENLEALAEAGAELVFFSPLHDTALPDGLGGVYLGGGYPELYAAVLSRNETMLASLREFGGVLYAECGGRLVLAEALEYGGDRYPMAGVVPGTATFSRSAKVTLGYREVRATRDSPVVRAGMVVKGHEFHYAVPGGGIGNLFESLDGRYREGYTTGRVHASFVHLYFPAQLELAQRFVDSAALYQSGTPREEVS